MKKILYIVSTLKRSGPTNQLLDLIKYLDRAQFKPTLITLSLEPQDSRWEDFEQIGVALHALNYSRIKGLFLAKSAIIQLIEQIQPDVIHTHGIRADGLSAQLKTEVPKLATIHNFPQEDYLMEYGVIKAHMMLRYHISAMKKIDQLVGCSQSVANNLKASFGLMNVQAIHNGVNHEQFWGDCTQRSWLRRQLNLDIKDTIWLVSGHLSLRKDPLFLIKAWEGIKQTLPNQHLVFVGDGPLKEACVTAASQNSNVHFIGRVSHVVHYLQGADYFISASQSEGFNLAFCEGMACGLPVLLSNNETHQELYNLDPNIGKLFQLNDRGDCIEKIKQLLYEDYSALTQAAQALIKHKLNAKLMSQNYQTVYNQLMGPR